MKIPSLITVDPIAQKSHGTEKDRKHIKKVSSFCWRQSEIAIFPFNPPEYSAPFLAFTLRSPDMTDPPCEITSFSPEWVPQTDPVEPKTEKLQSSSRKSSLQKKVTKGSSSKLFFRKAKKANNTHKLSTKVNLSEYLMENNKRSPLPKIAVGHKTGEICLEEISTEFTNVASIHSYEVNINKAARYCFKKLEDGTFSIEKKQSDVDQKNQEPSQTENTNKRKPKTIGPYAGWYAYKPLKICFKKRSKTFKKTLQAKDQHQTDYVTLKQVNHLNLETEQQCNEGRKPSQTVVGACHSQSSEGTWAAIKSLVMPRKRACFSSKTQSYFESQVHLKAKAGNAGVQRFTGKKTSAKLNIPCIRFSRGKKRSGHFEETDEEYSTVDRNETKDIMRETEANQDEKAFMIKCNLHQSLMEPSMDKKIDPRAEHLRDEIHATGNSPEKLEMDSDRKECDNIQPEMTAGIIHEKHIEKNPQESHDHRNVSEKNRGDSEAQRHSLDTLNDKNTANNELGGPEKEITVSDKEETRTSQIKFLTERPDLHSCSFEQRKLENKDAAKRVMSGDIEIHTHDRQDDNEQRPISPEYKAQNRETGANMKTENFLQHTSSTMLSKDGDESEVCSHQPTYHSFTTSDQYEMLLIKAASSLVKSVIQSSVQQVIDEMSLDCSHPPSVLQS
ncbi:A-kinase anchor protein 5 [Microcaecilia unicolor]|uniref:A-kinase anchor protein 5 n=1 Tax=Microcaecilia unicolor TaxID=1415580 RepID=A0A6P7YVQ9_9AMPH|nr:A-kinase anchor protein 5 [Microcaecilia unicolor]